MSILASAQVRRALQELRAVGEREDGLYRDRVRAREVQLGSTLPPGDRALLAVNAPLAISTKVGEVLHALALTSRPSLIVEFGASLGISTIYLASALADLGAGQLITTELIPEKATRTESALAGAGLSLLPKTSNGPEADASPSSPTQPRPALLLDIAAGLSASVVLSLGCPALSE